LKVKREIKEWTAWLQYITVRDFLEWLKTTDISQASREWVESFPLDADVTVVLEDVEGTSEIGWGLWITQTLGLHQEYELMGQEFDMREYLLWEAFCKNPVEQGEKYHLVSKALWQECVVSQITPLLLAALRKRIAEAK
jgi:hypothetical protein